MTMNWRRWAVICAAILMLAPTGVRAATSDVADAAMRGDSAAVRRLLTQKVDVNAPQADGATALHWAAYHDDLATVDVLIRAGANVRVANQYGSTPLALAAENGNPAIVQRLLEGGADPNERLLNGETVLMPRCAVAPTPPGNSRSSEVLMVDRSAGPPEGGHYVFAGSSLTSTLTH